MAENLAPNGLALAGVSVPENAPIGTVVGTFAGSDPNAGDTLTYELVGGQAGGNAMFTIVGNELRTAAALDHETASSYTIRARVVDQGGLEYGSDQTDISRPDVVLGPDLSGKVSLISSIVSAFGHSPIPRQLLSAADYQAARTDGDVLLIPPNDGLLAGLDAEAEIALRDYVYNGGRVVFLGGDGTAEVFNGLFLQEQNLPWTSAWRLIRSLVTRTSAAAGTSFEQTAVTLDPTFYGQIGGFTDGSGFKTSILPEGTEHYYIGTRDGVEYSSVFQMPFGRGVVGFVGLTWYLRAGIIDRAQWNAVLDAMIREVAVARRFTPFTVTVTDVNEAPTALSLSHSTFFADAVSGTVVGDLSAADPDAGDSLTFELVSGSGDTDNALFTIVGGQLRTAFTYADAPKPFYTVRVRAEDSGGLGVEKAFTIGLTPVPATVPEYAIDLGGVTTLGNIFEGLFGSALDVLLETVTIELVGPDADRFEAVDGVIRFKQDLDWEIGGDYEFEVVVVDRTRPDAEPLAIPYAVTIDANRAPLGVSFRQIWTSVPETGPITVDRTIGTVYVSDDGRGVNLMTLSGLHADLFELVPQPGGSFGLRLRDDRSFDYETQATYHVTITVQDPAFPLSTAKSVSVVQAVHDVDERPTAVRLTDVVASWPENTRPDIYESRRVASVVVDDDLLGTNVVQLTGRDAGYFWLDDGASGRVPGDSAVARHRAGSGALSLYAIERPGRRFDFERQDTYEVTIVVTGDGHSYWDAFGNPLPKPTTTVVFSLTDENDPPTAISLANPVWQIDENASTAERLKIGDLIVIDDALGSVEYSLGGPDANVFEIVGGGLYLRAGTPLNYAAKSQYTVTVSAADPSLPQAVPVTFTHVLRLNDVNQPPTAVALDVVVSSLPELPFSVGGSAIFLAGVQITDDSLGTNVITLSGPDADRFLVDRRVHPVTNQFTWALLLRTNQPLDFESEPQLHVTVSVADPEYPNSPPRSVDYELSITDVNEGPSFLQLTNWSIADVPVNSTLLVRHKIADILVTDDALGTNVLTLDGTSTTVANFEIVGSGLYLKAGVFITGGEVFSNSVSVVARDSLAFQSGSPWWINTVVSESFTFRAPGQPLNNPPSAISLSGGSLVSSMPESANTSNRIRIGLIIITDDGRGTNAVSLSGPDATDFEIDGNQVFLRAGTRLDFETRPALAFTLTASDPSLPNATPVTFSHTLTITDVNEPPTAVSLVNVVSTLWEDADTTSVTKLADIVITDDALGTNTLLLSGPDAARFSIAGTSLYLRAGTSLDYETKQRYDVTIAVGNASRVAVPGVTVAYTLQVGNVYEPLAASLSAIAGAILENNAVPAGYTLATLSIQSDAETTVLKVLEGPDAGFFQFIGSSLQFVDGVVFDFETKPSYVATIWLFDGIEERTLTYTWSVIDRDEPPTAIMLRDAVTTLPDTRLTTSRIKIADIEVIDDAQGPAGMGVSGDDFHSFEVVGRELYLKSGVGLDAASKSTYRVTVTAWGASGVGGTVSTTHTLSVVKGMELSAVTASLPEDTPTTVRLKMADIVSRDSGLDLAAVVLSGADAAAFEVQGSSLYLRAGVSLAYDTKQTYAVTITVPPAAEALSKQAVATFSLSLTAVNRPPTAVSFANVVSGISENSSTASRIKLADILVADDARGSNSVTLSGEDAAVFEILAGALYLRAGTVLDFESKASYSVTVSAADATLSGSSPVFANFTLAVIDVNERPSSVALSPASLTLPENAAAAGRVKVADVVIVDDALGANTVFVTLGTYSNRFEVDGTALYVKAGASLDFESTPSLYVDLEIVDAAISFSASRRFTLTLTNVNDPPGNLRVSVQQLYETHPTTSRVELGVIYFDDDGLGTAELTVSGDDAEAFEIIGNTLYLRAWVQLDYESKAVYSFTITVRDPSLPAEQAVSRAFEFNVLDDNDPPTGARLTNLVASLPENTSTATRIRVADIEIDDDGLGTNTIELTGTDAHQFERIGSSLFLRAGAVLNHGSKPQLAVTVNVRDYGRPGSQVFSLDYALAVTPMNRAPTAIALANKVTTLPENSGQFGRVKVADIVVTDDGLGTNTFTLSDWAADRFEVFEGGLYVRQGAVLNFEQYQAYPVTITVTDPTVANAVARSVDYVLYLTNVNEAPWAIELYSVTLSLAERGPGESASQSPRSVAGIDVRDDALGTNIVSVSGPDAGRFRVDMTSRTNGTLMLLNPGALDFESQPTLTVTLTAYDSALGPEIAASVTYTLSVTDVNEAPTAVVLANGVSSLPENTDTTSRVKVADIVVTDDALGTNTISLTGVDAASFEVVGSALYLKAGVALDYEAKTSYAVTVSVADATVPGSSPVSAGFTLTVTDVNEAPTAVLLANGVSSLPENSDTMSRVKVADIVITDDALGTNTISLTGVDAASFEVVGSAFYLKAGVALDYEAKTSYAVTVSVADATVPGSSPVSASFTLTVTDINEAPTAVVFANVTTAIAENTSTASAIKVADVVVIDDALGTNTLTLSGPDAAVFTLVGSTLYLNQNTSLNYEAKSSYSVTITAQDSTIAGGSSASGTFTLTVTAVNEAPTAVVLANGVSSLPENTDTTSRVKVADIVITDDALGTNTISLTGVDAASFEVVGSALYLKAGVALDYEAKTSYAVTVSVADATVPGSSPVSAGFTLTVTDVNEAPTAVVLANGVSGLPENTNTTSRVKAADIVITDDALGTNTISLTGVDAASFEVVGSALYLKAGVALDYEAKTSYAVNVSVADATVPGSSPVSASFTLTVTDVNEAPTAVSLTNVVSTLSASLDTTAAIKIADLVITDDALGTNSVSLAGADADSFTVVGTALYLKAGTMLNASNKSTYAVTVIVQDTSLADAWAVQVSYELRITSLSLTTLRAMPGTIDGEIWVSWATSPSVDVSEITDYSIQVSSNNGVSWTTVADGVSTSRVASLTGLDPTLTYVVRVAAIAGTAGVQDYTAPAAPLKPASIPVPFVLVGDPGNTADTNGIGAVAAPYRIGTFEITNAAYARFLNAIDPNGTFPNEVWDTNTSSITHVGITVNQSAAPGTKYGTKANMADKPVVAVSWFRAARMANWLHNGAQTYATSDASASAPQNTGAYTLGTATSGIVTVNAGARFRIPTEDQWYKAAYYKGGGTNSGYWTYATQSNTLPTKVTASATGVGSAGSSGNFANYQAGATWNGVTSMPTTVGSNGGSSVYGTFDMGGNAMEWNDRVSGTSRGIIGGSFASNSGLGKGVRSTESAGTGSWQIGFRLASDYQPEAAIAAALPTDPTSLSAQISGSGTNTSISVSWSTPASSSASVTGFVLQRSLDGGSTWTTLDDTLAASATSKDVTNIDLSVTRFVFRVAAKSAAGVGAFATPITVWRVNEAPTAVVLSSEVSSLPENTDTTSRIKLADIVIADDGLGVNAITLTGADAGVFEVIDQALYLRAGTSLDFEDRASYAVTVSVADTSLTGETPVTAAYTLAVTDINEPPREVRLENLLEQLSEDLDVSVRLRIANIVIDDDGLGTNQIVLLGPSAGLYEVVGSVLYLRAGIPLDYGASQLHELVVRAWDPDAVGRPADADRHLPHDSEPSVSVRLPLVNVPSHSGREFLIVTAGSEREETAGRSGDQELVIRGGGRVILTAANTHSGGTRVEAGEVIIRNPAALGSGTLEVGPGATVRLELGFTRAPVSRLLIDATSSIDLGRAGLTIASGGATLTDLRQLLVSGRNGGAWNGPGIRSRDASNATSRAVGYRQLADGSIVVGWAAFGDTNLDGTVNSRDFTNILGAGRYGLSARDSHWWQGDFNYDGRVASTDIVYLIAMFNSGPYNQSTPSGASGSSLTKSPGINGTAVADIGRQGTRNQES